MTPLQLLEEVKARFYSLLHNEQPKLEALLRQSLSAYQDNAGVMEVMKVRELKKDEYGDQYCDVPSYFLARVMVKGCSGDYIPSRYEHATKRLFVEGRVRLPLTLTYFVNLREVDLNEHELKPEITGLIQDHLELLIAVPNSERNRRVAIAGNIDTSDIPTEEVLTSRKVEVEQKMKAARSAMPMVSIQS